MVLDELGYLPFSKAGVQLLFHLMSSCYENMSVIIATNLDFKEWDNIFHNHKMTVALLDRLTRHCEIIETGVNVPVKETGHVNNSEQWVDRDRIP